MDNPAVVELRAKIATKEMLIARCGDSWLKTVARMDIHSMQRKIAAIQQDDNPTYRQAMIDAGRGHLLRG
jgi:hypothetical protein